MDEDTFREYRLRKIYCFEGEYTINMPKEIVFVFFFKLEYFQKRLFWVKLWLGGRLLAGIAGNLRSHRNFWSRNSSLSLMSFIPANIRQCKNYINCINLSVLIYKNWKRNHSYEKAGSTVFQCPRLNGEFDYDKFYSPNLRRVRHDNVYLWW